MESQPQENQDTFNSEQDVVPYSLISNDFNISKIASRVDDSWTWPTYNFWTQYGDLGNPANPVVRIGPGFTSWSITSIGMPGEEKVFRDTLMRALQNSLGATNGRINATNDEVSSLNTWVSGINWAVNDIKPKIDANTSAVTSLKTSVTYLDGRKDYWNNNISALVDRMNAEETKSTSFTNNISVLASDRDKHAGRLSHLEANGTAYNDSIQALLKRVGNVESINVEQQKWLEGLNESVNKNKDNLVLLNLLNTNQLSINEQFDNRLKEIESFDFASIIDLTILVTAINAVGSKVQDLINVFDVTDPQPDSFAFFFQAHIKSQTLAIVDALAMVDESLNDNFVNYFSDSKNGQFWTDYKEFSDFQMAVFFGVFFESLQEHWESNWLTVLDVWNTTNSFLATIAGWLDQIQVGVADSKEILSIITNWLKLIYEKPVPSFNVPAFDYARLERMLKKLEFGEVVNEAGTNIWDFLTSLIDNLGDIITTQLKEFTKVLSEILDFLDGLIDKLIGLIDIIVDNNHDLGEFVKGVLNRYIAFKLKGTDSNKSRWDNTRWWDKFLGDVEKISLSMQAPDKSVLRTKNWIDTQVVGSFAMLYESLGNDPLTIDYMLKIGRDKMSDRQKQMSKEFQLDLRKRIALKEQMREEIDYFNEEYQREFIDVI